MCRGEIKRLQDKEGRPTDNYMVIGEVVGVHIDEQVLTNGLIDIAAQTCQQAWLYMDFATTESVCQCSVQNGKMRNAIAHSSKSVKRFCVRKCVKTNS